MNRIEKSSKNTKNDKKKKGRRSKLNSHIANASKWTLTLYIFIISFFIANVNPPPNKSRPKGVKMKGKITMSRKTKKFLSGLLAAVLVIGCCSMIGFASKGFTVLDPSEWEVRTRNEDNLLDNADYTLAEGVTKNANGITLDVDKHGAITIDGKHDDAEAMEIELGTLALEAGDYTFVSGYKGSGTSSVYLKYVTSSGTYLADFNNGDGTFTLSAAATGTVSIVIAPDYQFNGITLRPVVYQGEDAVSFYN